MYRKVPLALIAVMASAAPAFAFSPAYNDGVALYQAGKYSQAAVALAKATGTEPGNALAHYYFANALVHVGDHAQAAREYRTSLILEPYGSVSAFCRAALHGYSQPVPSQKDAVTLRDTVGSATKSEASHTAMERQLAREKARQESIINSNVSFAGERGKYDAAKLDELVRERIAAVHADITRPTLGKSYQDQEYLAAKEAEIRKQAEEERERIKREAGETAARYRRVADERQKVLDDTAHSLESQMHGSGANSGVRLLSEGTDLYVRRYASVPTRKPVPDAHQAVVRLYGHGANAEANPNPPNLNSATPDTHARQVSGKVLN